MGSKRVSGWNERYSKTRHKSQHGGHNGQNVFPYGTQILTFTVPGASGNTFTDSPTPIVAGAQMKEVSIDVTLGFNGAAPTVTIDDADTSTDTVLSTKSIVGTGQQSQENNNSVWPGGDMRATVGGAATNAGDLTATAEYLV